MQQNGCSRQCGFASGSAVSASYSLHGARSPRFGYRVDISGNYWLSHVKVTNAYRIALKSLARRYLELRDEIADQDVMIAAIVDELSPELIKRHAVGYKSALQLLITAGDNSQRLRTESGFAALCGVSLVPVSSGKTNRYRLNWGGDRAANSALHIIAIGRLRTDDKTKEYVTR